MDSNNNKSVTVVVIVITLLIIAAVIFAAVKSSFGWLSLLWLGCMTLDYLTGTIGAIKTHTWSSTVARDGLWKKSGMGIAVLVALLTDSILRLALENTMVELPFEYKTPFTVLAMVWYAVTELGSVLENLTKFTTLPPFLTKPLAIMEAQVTARGNAVAGEEHKDG